MPSPQERIRQLRPPMLHRLAHDPDAGVELRQRAADELERRGYPIGRRR